MPRRYHIYAEEYQIFNILSTSGAMVLGIAFILPIFNMIWSLKYGKKAPANPWGAKGLEWTIPSPPATHNFDQTPIVTEEAYAYSPSKGGH
jgi:cytochrome c oxidase subunit 1